MKRRLLPAGLTLLLLDGCMVGPTYVKPDAATPSTFKEKPPASYDAGIWAMARPDDSRLRTNWWELFGDPQLNALEAQVDTANEDLKSADARFRQARALVGIAKAAELPTIDVEPGVGALRDSPNAPYFPTSRGASATGNFVLPLDLSYEVDLWGRIHRGVTAARETAQASAADLATVKLSLNAELALDYFELRAADRQQRLLDDTVKAYQDSLDLTQDRLNGGEAPESDAAQARTQLDSARVLDADIGVRRAQYEHAIAVLIGKPPAAFALPPAPLEAPPPIVPVALPSELLQRRPDIAAAERRAAAANEQIGIAQAAYYPSLKLSAQGGFESSSGGSLFNWPSLFWAVGATMAETIFDGGRRAAVKRAARANYDATIADYRQTTLTAFQEVEDNLAALRILERETSRQDEAVAAAQDSLRLSTDRYVGGRDNYLLVITNQTALLDNERNAVDIERRRMDATVLLVKALGGGWKTADLPTK